MTDQTIRYAVEVRVTHRKELENQLDRAVEGAIQEALKDPGRGVQVIRHDHQRFTVELSHDVPHGTISELALYPPSAASGGGVRTP
jgi:isoaspartyl peptidase/L-asparaginase-like protein (Ntn-hydrolase superfamily)